MPAQDVLAANQGHLGHHQSKMRSLHPGISCSQKKQMLGGGMGCAFGSIC